MTLMTPSFEDPPPRPRANLDWQPTIAALEARPGEWAKVDGPLSSSTVTGRKRSLQMAAAKLGVTVATSIRSDKTGRHWVYARVMR